MPRGSSLEGLGISASGDGGFWGTCQAPGAPAVVLHLTALFTTHPLLLSCKHHARCQPCASRLGMHAIRSLPDPPPTPGTSAQPPAGLQAPTDMSADPEVQWVKFTSQDKKKPCILDARLVITITAGPPAVWSGGLIEVNATPGATPREDVPCNAWFFLEAEVTDEWGNKCACAFVSHGCPACLECQAVACS